MSYGTDYIDIPSLKPVRVGRVNKMTKSTTPKAAEVSTTSRKQYAKTRGEHFKDMLIVALVVGVAAFVGGMHFSNQQHSQLSAAVQSASVTAVTPAKK